MLKKAILVSLLAGVGFALIPIVSSAAVKQPVLQGHVITIDDTETDNSADTNNVDSDDSMSSSDDDTASANDDADNDNNNDTLSSDATE